MHAQPCAGYGSYGPPPGWGHGGRVLLLRSGEEPDQADTWIRLENGARVDQSVNPRYKKAAQSVCEAGEGAWLLPHPCRSMEL